MRITVLLLLTVLSFEVLSQEEACQLVVKVENVKELKGSLKLALYDHKEKFLKTAMTWDDKPIEDQTMVFTFDSLERGVYAVSLFHDENDNGKLDANFMGIPSEPYAFSNNAKGFFGPPSFQDCQFEVIPGTMEIVISL